MRMSDPDPIVTLNCKKCGEKLTTVRQSNVSARKKAGLPCAKCGLDRAPIQTVVSNG
jgi:predicted SprT family Zn-dependent metalloprotease